MVPARSTGASGALDIAHRLTEICGPRFARLAGPADEVAGRAARWVAVPGGPRAAARVLRLAARHELTVVPRGAGTKIDWGAAPERLDIMLDTGRLAGIGHQAPDRGTVEVGAGTPLRAVQATLERTGQRLALDAPSPGATLGGVLAADEAGPLRHRHGTACDQLVGLRYLDADGELTEAGGGATGLAQARLLCGSEGALGVLVSAVLRVQAVPATRVWVTRPVWTPLEVHDLIKALLAARLDPAAVELDLPVGPASRPHWDPRAAAMACHPSMTGRAPTGSTGAGSLVVLLEGGPAEVAERSDRLVRLFGGRSTVARSAPPWWRSYPFAPGDTALRLEVPITDLHAAVYALRDATGGPVPVRGSAGLGVVHAALPGGMPPDRVATILAAVRSVLLARQGRCVVLAAPPAVRRAVDLWGELADLARLRAVKQHLDPGHRLSPGRLPGGL
ncbi:glycolate oxidase FAD binding subunit [Micromonospora phaseoli]|uniref:Glycolate oxidase FAD binding subunit n=1 Tax=Micromonospora phaseoli TaxID=1144548 RepID=A0A1H7ARW0_9ACTN|nr:FAD-binding oxidoreductase [Micromonospora phaseoli]PZV96209.1 glycolate oxidase FAD binding subunit [Micromonospora phaseoli]GIJ79485.1 glycolate oxidase [Micromonospora phaseoli]SEJ68371.1 glycolate oxidase FAD binding subunit [Micromonospora phaseoli]